MHFAVLGLPRSGTTWAANWLTAGGAICLHDPIDHYTPDQLMAFDPGRAWGVSCTGLYAFPGVVERLQCPVVVVERDVADVNTDLVSLGLPAITDAMLARFRAVPGLRVPFELLWQESAAREIWRFLRPDCPFDVQRYKLLVDMHVQPRFETLRPNMQAVRANIDALAAAC